MSKRRVLAKHRDATSAKNAQGWWDIRAGDKLLGQGSTATMAWWDAYQACYPDRFEAGQAPAAIATGLWPFPVSVP